MLLREVLQKTQNHFEKLGFERPKLEAENVISSALNWKRLELFLKLDYPLAETEVEKLREWVKRSSKGEPLAYIEGKREFYGFDFVVEPGILIPRNETELLVDEAIQYLNGLDEDALILDLGCGSGCIGLSILKAIETPKKRKINSVSEENGQTNEVDKNLTKRFVCKLVGVDASSKAIEISKKNATNLLLESRSQFVNKEVENLNKNDFTDQLPNVVVANPPYIAEHDTDIHPFVKQYEPHEALFAKDNGLAFYYSWIPKAVECSAKDAILIFEIGWQQAKAISQFLQSNFPNLKFEVLQDYNQRDRIIKITKA